MTHQDTQPPAETLARDEATRIARTLMVQYFGPGKSSAVPAEWVIDAMLQYAALTSRAGGDAGAVGEVGQDREAILAAYRHLKKVGDRLCVCAETTGGVAGPDEGLQKAIQDWGNCRHLLRAVRAAASEPDCLIAAGQSLSSATPKPPAGGDALEGEE